MKKIFLFIAILWGLLSVPLFAQGPNMSKYITLTVQSGQPIKLDFKANAGNTPVRIVSGSNTQDITVGADWFNGNVPSNYSITSDGTTMTVYGDISAFRCANNGANLKAIYTHNNPQLQALFCNDNSLTYLNLRNNRELRELVCYNNSFTTEGVNKIYCSLPAIQGAAGKCHTLNTGYDNNHATVSAATSDIARQKNWEVKYYNNSLPQQNSIPNNGNYTCGEFPENSHQYITLNVTHGAAIKLDFKAKTNASLIRIESGNNTQSIRVGTSWYNGNEVSTYTFTAEGTLITIYGDVSAFKCSNNQANVKSIDLDALPGLEELYCNNNEINSLDLRHNTELSKLVCNNNHLTSLNLTNNQNIKTLVCYGNDFTAATINGIYCALPQYDNNGAVCYPLNTDEDANNAEIVTAASQNARGKNWAVKFYNNGVDPQNDVPAGTAFPCPTTQPNMNKFITLSVLTGKNIKLKLAANNANTPVRIVTGNTTHNLLVDTELPAEQFSITSDGTIFTIYGDVSKLNVNDNQDNITNIDLNHNSGLVLLHVNNNKLTSLDLSNCSDLIELQCNNCTLTNLNLSSCTELASLGCSKNKLTTLNLQNSNKLEYLFCQDNELTDVTLSGSKLKQINASNNKLTSLDLSNSSFLEDLYCQNNLIVALDLKKSIKLKQVNVSNNKIKTLNFAPVNELNVLNCRNNAINTLKLGENTNLTNIDCDSNKIAKLVFTNNNKLEILSCNYNKLDTLDIVNAVALKELYCQSNLIKRVILPNATKLEKVNCSYNLIDSLYLHNSPSIKQLVCNNNKLNTIAVADNNQITELICNNNQLNELAPNKSAQLAKLNCANNKLKTLNISTNAHLSYVDCQSNILTELVFATQSPVKVLDCSKNKLTTLDLSNNLNLETINCSDNSIIDLSFSNNTKVREIYCFKNPFTTLSINKLYCSLPTVTGDSAVCYSINNSNDAKYVDIKKATSDNARRKLWAVKYYNNGAENQKDVPNTGTHPCGETNVAKYVTLTVVKDKKVAIDFKATENNTAVTIESGTNTERITVNNKWYSDENGKYTITSGETTLKIYGNISELNISGNGNIITAIDLERNADIVNLNCSSNALTALNLTAVKNITTLNCSNNKIAELSLTANTKLTDLVCNNNEIPALNLDKNVALDTLICNNNLLKALSLSKNTKLVHINCNNNKITELNLSNNKAIAELYCMNNEIANINLSANSQLKKLDCNTNKIETLNITSSNLLTHINCGANSIASIDLNNKKDLVELYCNNNKITNLDVTTNTKLQVVRCDNNNLDKNALNTIYCSLPERTAEESAKFFPANTSRDNNYSDIETATSNNAREKNWQVNLFANGVENDQTAIPSNGTYPCAPANMEKYITIDVVKDVPINLNFKAAKDNTPVRVESGASFEAYTVGTNWYAAEDTPIIFTPTEAQITIYGDVSDFDCSNNTSNLTNVDFSKNNTVTNLICANNSISKLDISKLTDLTHLNCNSNLLVALNVKENKKLKELYCDNNKIKELELENNTVLTTLSCATNQLSALSLKDNAELNLLVCFNNAFNTENLNNLYCSLPERSRFNKGRVYPLNSQEDLSYANLVKATSDNARDKFWDVLYNNSNNPDEINVPSYGIFFCDKAPEDKYITLNVKSKETISFKLKANQDKTPVRVKSGNRVADFFVGKSWNEQAYTVEAANQEVTIYGDITAIDLSNNEANLNGIDVTNNADLTELNLENNNISAINLAPLTNLRGLNVANNKLQSLVLDKNTKLDYLYCNDNQLTALDLRYNTRITRVWCHNNQLNTEAVNTLYCSLPTVTGASGNLYTLNTVVTDTTSAEYTQYKAVLASTSDNARIKNWLVLYYNNGDLTNQSNIPSNGQFTCPNTPPNMTKYITLNVMNQQQIGISVKANASNTKVRVVNGGTTNDYDVSTAWTNIPVTSNGTAIVIYGNVAALDCSGNKANLTDIDLRNNLDLNVLDCSDNAIASLNLSLNTALEELYCNKTKLSVLNLENNKELVKLIANNNNFTEINLSKNTKLTEVELTNNNLTSLDLSNNSKLVSVSCGNNKLTDINLSNATELKSLSCNSNELTAINLSNATNLETINCIDNKLMALDFSASIKLNTILCYNNQLRTEAINKMYCSLPTIPNGFTGKCYPVNTIPAKNSPEYDIYSAILEATSKNARDKNWEVKYYSNADAIQNDVPSHGNYACSNFTPNTEKYVILTVAEGKSIKMNFKASKDNTAVRVTSGSVAQDIIAGTNWNAKPFEVKANSTSMIIYGDITDLDCSNNEANLNDIIIKKNLDLTGLVCNNNSIKSLDLTENTKLAKLACAKNQLNALNIANNVRLTEVDCSENMLSELNVKDNNELTKLFIRGNEVKSIDLSKNTKLQQLDLAQNKIEDINLIKNTNLTTLNCATNNIKALNLSNNIKLAELNCSNNKLTALSLSTNSELKKVLCYNNPFTTDAVNELYCSLPTIEGTPSELYTLNTEADENHALVVAATSKNARDKNWLVKYYNNADATQNDIPSNGTFACPAEPVNLNRFITLTVDTNKAIKLNIKADDKNTQVLLVSGTRIETLTAGTDWYASESDYTFTTEGNTLTIYGNVSEFSCEANDTNITAIDVTKNAQLIALSCANNKIANLDLSKNVSLTELNCASNAINALDLTNNTKLVKLSCYNNPFTTEAMNQLYCSLPTIMGDAGTCYALDSIPDSTSADLPVYEAVLAATSDNARAKNWKVLFKTSGENIPSNGNYNCNTGVDESIVSGINVFPNPAYGKVQVQLKEEVNETLILVDLTGRAVLTENLVSGKANIDVSNLTAGIYFIKVGNRVQKLTVK